MKFWIPSLKQLVKSIENMCVQCKIAKAKAFDPMMGYFPPERQTPYERPFTFSGIDFFGPFKVKSNKKKIGQCWVLIITCMTVRAVHMEVVEKLNTETTLLRLNDFINRRGLPRRIRSDCATYFKSSNKKLHQILTSSELVDSMGKRGMEWIHNCPNTPHTGGAWERLIGCARRTLEVSCKDVVPTIDTFRSLVIEAENIINNRPLTDVALRVEEEEPITPNHFLIGSTNHRQETDEIRIQKNSRKQLNILRMLKNRFWKRWINEFIPKFNRRPKWNTDQGIQLKEDDIIFFERNGKWVKGLVKKLYFGKDNKIRFLDISTVDGEVKKHLSKILIPDFRGCGDC